MDQNMTLEKRIAAELYSYQGRMSVFVDDLRGSTVEIGADEEFETASTIKAFILAVLYLQASRGRADLEEEITYEASQFVDGSGMLRALGVGAKLKVKDTATMMIICSDNIATNMIIDYLGLDTINACIRELGFGHTVLHNPLHFDRYDKLGTTTPRDYAALFAQVAKGTLVSKEASAAMLGIFRQQHYNTMLTHDFPQFYLDCEETGEPELIWVASKSGSMNACRNDGGIIHTPYGEYVIVLMNKEFHDIIEYNDHPAIYSFSRPSIVKPFQIQSIIPELSSISLLSHSIGCFTSVQPFLEHTSAARSRSNPTYSPLSSLYPYGGNSASKPTVNVSPLFFATLLSFFLLPQPLITPAITATRAAAIMSFFKIAFNFFLLYQKL